VLARDSDGAVPTGEVDDVLRFAAAAAGTMVASADVSGGQSAAAVAIFTVMAACSVLIPVLGYLILGARLDPTLGNAKDWLISNNAAVMSVLLFVFGANLLGDAIGILTA
jgi:hypothetical protein